MPLAAAAYLSLMVGAGLVLVRALGIDLSARAGMLGMSMLAGAAVLGLALMLLSIAGVPPSRGSLLMLAAVCGACAAGVLRVNGRIVRPPVRPLAPGVFERVLVPLALALPLAAAAWVAATSPAEWDGFAIWLLKAKVLHLESLRPLPVYFTDLSMGYSHLEYPPLVPLLVAGMHAAVGRADMLAAHAVFLYLAAGLVLTLFGALGAVLCRPAALLLCVTLVAAPAWMRWAVAPLADMPLAAFHLAMVVLLCRVLRGDAARSGIVLAAILGAATALTKLEGQPLALVTTAFFLLAVRRRGGAVVMRYGVALIGIQLMLVVPWLWVVADVPRVHEDYAGRVGLLMQASSLARMAGIAPTLAAHASIEFRWGALWLLPLVLAMPGWRAFREPVTRMLWLLCIAHLGLYTVAWIVSPWQLELLLATTMERLLLHVAPVCVILAGAHAACIRGLAVPARAAPTT